MKFASSVVSLFGGLVWSLSSTSAGAASIAEIISSDPELTTLTAAATAAGFGLEGGPDGITVFAPTNDAFIAAGITSLDGLTAEDLAPILTYHVLDT